MNELQTPARHYLLASAELKRQVVDSCLRPIVEAAQLLVDTFRAGGKLLLCGNGGSAADCQHLAAEFVSRFTKDIERPGLPAIALTTDTSFLTASANDYGYDGVFARQVETLGRREDTLIGISTSGESENVLRAVKAAQAIGMKVIGLTGNGGRLRQLVDLAIAVPSSNTQHIQEAHLAIEHLLCHLVERELFSQQCRSRSGNA